MVAGGYTYVSGKGFSSFSAKATLLLPLLGAGRGDGGSALL